MNNDRYSRQILFPPIGKKGQKKLAEKHVLLIGAGALGSSASEMLTRAGIGKLTIIDRDYIESSNLQRQTLYTEEDVAKKLPKAIAAQKRLQAVNSACDIQAIVSEASIDLLENIIASVDVILDATDNFETRMLINDAAQKYNKPWIYGACVGSVGMSYTIIPGVTPCLHCLLQTIPLQGMTCDTGGIIAPAVQMVVTHQVTEAMKLLVEDTEALRGTFLSFDLWNNHYQSLKVNRMKKSTCTSCGTEPTYPFLDKNNQTKTAILCGRDTVQIRPSKEKKVSLNRLAESLQNNGYAVKLNPFLLSVQMEKARIVLFTDGRALVHDTKDPVYAKTIYDKLLG
ncbi:MoeB/ThiF family adenylyltransferase [Niallia sp. 01092]|uniref:MoeB/ThiF family adenylyltransferase n=1 Tax=unclassified Niallia TaxID=2837522 RepID=UPI003FD66CF8